MADAASLSKIGHRAPAWVWILALLPGSVQLGVLLQGFWQARPQGLSYLGFRFMLIDHLSYLGLAELARDRRYPALIDPFVSEAQSGRFLMGFHWLVARLASLCSVDVRTAWYGLMPLASLAFFLSLWVLLQRLVAEERVRRLSYLLACLGGGLDPLLRLWTEAMGASLPESYFQFWNWCFAGAAANPMWLASGACLHLAMIFLWDRWSLPRSDPQRWRLCYSGVVTVAIAVSYTLHPYTGLASIVVTAVFVASLTSARSTTPSAWGRAAWKEMAESLAPILVAAALVGGLALWARQDSVYLAVSQNVFFWKSGKSGSGFPLHYGFLSPLALLGLWQVVARGRRDRWVVVAWLGAIVLLVLQPLLPGIKFQFLLFAPLVIVASDGAWWLWDQLQGRLQRRSLRWLGALVALLLLCGFPLQTLLSLSPGRPVGLVPQAQLDMLARLAQLPPGAVLTSPATAILVPWKAHKVVFDGHWFLSPKHQERLELGRRFFAPGTDPRWRRQFLRRHRIRYVVEDYVLRGHTPKELDGLQLRLLYESDYGRIFEVVAP